MLRNLARGAVCRGNASGLRPQLTGMPERVTHTDDGLLSLFRHEEPTSLLAAQSESLRGKAGVYPRRRDVTRAGL